jgi:hypothetical protein
MSNPYSITKILTSLARKSIEYYLSQRQYLPIPDDIPQELFSQQAGVFVSLKKKGKLRGCIGTFLPQQENVILEIIHNAVSSATEDPRFPRVTLNELSEVDITIDILTKPEPISSPEELNPKHYGVIVQRGWRKGLLLPDIEGVETIEEQIRIARLKAGIGSHEPVELFRFRVDRYSEKEDDGGDHR